MTKTAVVVFIENKTYLVNQCVGLAQSMKNLRNFELVVFGTSDALERIPDDLCSRKIVYNPISYEGTFKGYHYINSISCLSTPESYQALSDYEYILRTDTDTFLSPSIDSFIPSVFTYGKGGYGNLDVPRILQNKAREWRIRHQKITNVGSTWLGGNEIVLSVAAKTVEYTKRIIEEDFSNAEGLWPGYYRGVASMYGAELAINELCDISVYNPLFDTDSTSRDSIQSVFHVHCWHTDNFYSKFAYDSGVYNTKNRQELNPDIICDYCLLNMP